MADDEDGQAATTAMKALSIASEAAGAIRTQSDLWQDAFRGLTKPEQEALDFENPTLQVMKDALKETLKAQNELMEKEWKIEFRGKKYPIRDIFGTMVDWMKAFESVVDKGAALDVSGKVALPWAAIKFVLEQLGNSHDQYVAVGGGIATVTGVINYYVQFEPLYLSTDSKVVQRLKSSVVEVYVHVLKFLSKARQYYKNRTGNFIDRAVAPLKSLVHSSKDYSGVISTIETKREEVDIWANLVRRESQNDIIGLARGIESRLQAQDEAEMLNKLSPFSAVESHAKISHGRLAGTGLWLLTENNEYRDWRQFAGSSLLWLSGSVGTGKTTLTSLVVDAFLDNMTPREASPMLYFYCTKDQTPEQVLQNIVRQLVRIRPINAPADLEDVRNNGLPLDGDKSAMIIRRLLKTHQSMTIIIDAVDACAHPDESRPNPYTYVKLLNDLSSMMGDVYCRLKVLFTTRDANDNARRFFDDLRTSRPGLATSCISKHTVLISNHTQSDVARLIRHTVEHWLPAEFLPNERQTDVVDGAKENVVEDITAKSGPMFLWAIYTMNKLRNSETLKTADDVSTQLKTTEFPKILEESYDKSYEAIAKAAGTPSGAAALRALKLLFCAQKVLSTGAFLCLVFMDEYADLQNQMTAETLVSWCQGFIVLDPTSDTFRFLHPSVEGYLRDKEGFEIQAHEAVAVLCLQFLSKPIYETGRRSRARRRRLNDHPGLHRGRQERRQPARRSSSTRSSNRSSNRPGSRDREEDRHGESNNNRRTRSDREKTGEGDETRRQLAPGTWAWKHKEKPIQSFQDYAALYWPTHSTLSGDLIRGDDLKNRLRNMLSYDLLLEPCAPFQSWIFSVQRLLSERPFGFYGAQMEKELEKSVLEPATPFLVACIYGFTDIVEGFCGAVTETKDASDSTDDSTGDIPIAANSEGLSGMHMASIFGHVDVVNILAKVKDSEADRGVFWGLDCRGKTALLHAVEQARDAKILQALLNTKAKSHRNNTILIAAMGNPYCAKDLVHILLGGKPGLPLSMRAIPTVDTRDPDLHDAVVQYPHCTLQLAMVLIPPTEIREQVLVSAAHWKKPEGESWDVREDIWDFLLGRNDDKGPPRDSRVDDRGPPQDLRIDVLNLLEAAIEVEDADLVAYLLDYASSYRQDLSFLIPEKLLKMSLRPHHSLAIFSMILDNDDPYFAPRWTEGVLQAALENYAVDGNLISKLCSRLVENTPLTKEMMVAIAGNIERGAEVLQALKAKYEAEPAPYVSDQLEIPRLYPGEWEAVVQAITANGNYDLLLFLSTQSSLRIGYDTFKEILTEVEGEWFLDILRDRYATISRPTHLLASEEPENYWDGVVQRSLQIMLENGVVDPGVITQGVVEDAAAVRGRKVLQYLFEVSNEGGRTIRVTTTMLARAAVNYIYGHDVLPFLQEKADYGLAFDDAYVLEAVAAVGSLRTMRLFLDKPQESYSMSFAKMAASNPNLGVVEFVFRYVKHIDLDVLVAAANNSDEALDHLLRQFKGSIGDMASRPQSDWPSLCRIVAKMSVRTSILQQLLAHTTGIDYKGLLIAAAQNRHGTEMASFLFDRIREVASESTEVVKVSTEMLTQAAGNQSLAPEMLRVFFNECEDAELENVITEDVLIAAAANDGEAPEALRMLCLEEGVDRKITEAVLGSARENTSKGRDTRSFLDNICNRVSKPLVAADAEERTKWWVRTTRSPSPPRWPR